MSNEDLMWLLTKLVRELRQLQREKEQLVYEQGHWRSRFGVKDPWQTKQDSNAY